jgi:hypothetical protein
MGLCEASAQTVAQARPTTLAGHVYINLSTGERVISRSESSPVPLPRGTSAHFVNEDLGAAGDRFWALDDPYVPRMGQEAADWGDVPFDTPVDTIRFAYATTIPRADGDSVPGLNVVLWVHDCNNGRNDPSAIRLWALQIVDLLGADPAAGTAQTWIYTIDLSGSGFEFEIGDTDGSHLGVSGRSSTGCDRDDWDGSPLADFSWSYTFRQNQAGPVGIIGPALVLPAFTGIAEDDATPSGADGNARGVEDLIDVYRNPFGSSREDYLTTIFFGGWTPTGSNPYASLYIGLYGPGSACASADYNDDGGVDILDFLDFIADFSVCDAQPSPCGEFGNPDLNDDGITDILDLLDFLQLFATCG